MNYLNKYRGTAAANLEYQGGGKWIVRPSKDNRYRKLTNIVLGKEIISAIDLEGMAGMIQVGDKLPGYNREITSINEISDYEFMVECTPGVRRALHPWE